MLKNSVKILRNLTPRVITVRSLTHYPVDDVMFGLTEEQSAVIKLIFTISFYLNTSLIILAATIGI